jgi:hypothetical protein
MVQNLYEWDANKTKYLPAAPRKKGAVVNA